MSRISLILTLVALTLVFVIEGRSDRVRGESKAMDGTVATGVWGGEHIRLQVTDNGASLEYDCAHGTIDQPLKLDAEGRFEVKGTHTRERGGPVRRDERPDNQPARYTGRVEGQTMTLKVLLIDSPSATAETYTLTQGAAGRLMKCR